MIVGEEKHSRAEEDIPVTLSDTGTVQMWKSPRAGGGVV